MLLFADSEVWVWVDDTSVEITSLYEWHAIGGVVSGIHDTNGNPSVFGKEVTKCDDIPIVR